MTVCPRDRCSLGHPPCPLLGLPTATPLAQPTPRRPLRQGPLPPTPWWRRNLTDAPSPSPSSFPCLSPHLSARTRRAAAQVPLCESAYEQAIEPTRSAPACSPTPRYFDQHTSTTKSACAREDRLVNGEPPCSATSFNQSQSVPCCPFMHQPMQPQPRPSSDPKDRNRKSGCDRSRSG